MPTRKRKRRERTHDWQEIQQYTLWPEQEVYERLRPIVLFGETAAERAKEIGASERTLHHRPGGLSKRAWRAYSAKSLLQLLIKGAVSRKRCANSSSI